MTSDDLSIFLIVAQEGSITKAAQRLGYVQSNVSARISNLENELATQLFQRHSRGMSLTPAGITLMDYAENINGLLREAKVAVMDVSTPKGSLTIGALETTAAVRLPAILAAYHRQYPEVDLTLITGSTSSLIDKVLQHQLDGAFVTGPIQQENVKSITIFQEKLVLITGPSTDDFDVLMNQPLLVLHPNCSYRSRLTHWLSSEGRTQPRMMEFGTIEAILGGVSAGLGISLLPASIVQKHEEEGSIRVCNIPNTYQNIETVFIYRKDAFLSTPLKALIDAILQ